MQKGDLNTIYDLIIMGGGPAGLTAGLYAARAGLNVVLLEKLAVGGQVARAERVENYPGFPGGINGVELSERMREQAEEFGLQFIREEVVGIAEKQEDANCYKIVKGKESEYISLAVIVASGAEPRELGVPGEKELCGKGVSYCATCDGPLFRNQDIVVVGGGDAAVEEALFLAGLARRVTLVHRRNRLRATKVLQERILSHQKVDVVWDSVVTEVLGESQVEGVRIRNLREEKEYDVICQGVFVFVGIKPNAGFLKGIVRMNKKGYIITDENMKTSVSGIYACGDVRDKLLPQVVTACGEAATAAVSARLYIEQLKGQVYGGNDLSGKDNQRA